MSALKSRAEVYGEDLDGDGSTWNRTAGQALRDDLVNVGREAETKVGGVNLDMLDVSAIVVDASLPGDDAVPARVDRDHRRTHRKLVAELDCRGNGIDVDAAALEDFCKYRVFRPAHDGGAERDHMADEIGALTRQLARRYEELHAKGGAQTILREWESRSSYAHGRRVRVRLAEETFEGTTRGLEPDGALRVETDTGLTRTVHAGDVTALRPNEG